MRDEDLDAYPHEPSTMRATTCRDPAMCLDQRATVTGRPALSQRATISAQRLAHTGKARYSPCAAQ
jgi:hypothetical protein